MARWRHSERQALRIHDYFIYVSIHTETPFSAAAPPPATTVEFSIKLMLWENSPWNQLRELN